MTDLTKLELNFPGPIKIDGVGHIKSLKVSDIVRCRRNDIDGESIYNSFLNIFLIKKAQFLESISEMFSEKQLRELDTLPLFTLLILFPKVREVLYDALSFFLEEKVIFLEQEQRFSIIDSKLSEESGRLGEVGSINADNYPDVKNVILARNYITPPSNSNGKRRTKRMIAFDKKIEEGRKKSRRFKEEQEAMQLGNIVSKVSRYAGAPVSSVYDWTIYQLYDQFSEINTQIQLNTIMRRWSTWGKDDFDFSLWYKTMNNRRER